MEGGGNHSPGAQDPARWLEAALSGDPTALRNLALELRPVVQARVARVLLRRPDLLRGRNVRQEVEDVAQDVYVALLGSNAKALRAWSGERGLSFQNFVGLIAERETVSVLRSSRRRPWLDGEVLPEGPDEAADPSGDLETTTASTHLLRRVLGELRGRVTEMGWQIFFMLFVEESSVDDACARTGLTPAAVYQWRSRLRKICGEIAKEVLSENGAIERSPSQQERGADGE